MHVVKDHDERLNEFLDTAQRLFMEHGYEETPVAAIIDAVGVSKGAFYHYFAGKEALLDALVERTTDAGRLVVQSIADDPNLPALEKLNRVFSTSMAFKARNRDVIVTVLRVLYNDRNLQLRKRMEKRSLAVNAPLIATILAQGHAEGTFDIDDPTECAALILQLGSTMVERIATTAVALATTATGAAGSAAPPPTQVGAETPSAGIRRALCSYRQAITRILGAEPGTIIIIEDDVLSILTGENVMDNKAKELSQ